MQSNTHIVRTAGKLLTAIDEYDASEMLTVLDEHLPGMQAARTLFLAAKLWSEQLSSYAEWALLHKFSNTAPATDEDM